MTLDEVMDLLAQNQVPTFTTHRPSAKYANLLRDPHCAMLVMSPDLRNYAVIDGDARIVGGRDADPETVRLALWDVYGRLRARSTRTGKSTNVCCGMMRGWRLC